MTKKQSKYVFAGGGRNCGKTAAQKRAIAKQNAEALQKKQLEKLNGAYERATGSAS